MLIALIAVFSACDTIKNLPTNTSGGLFSLNGSWKLLTTTDNNAQVRTVVTITPGLASAFVKSFENNNYCYRAGDEAWKSLSSRPTGGFTIQYLASACNATLVYKAGEITVLSNDQIRITSKTNTDINLIQEWARVTK